MKFRISISLRLLAILAILAALYSAGSPASAAPFDQPAVVQSGPPYYLDDPTNTDAPYEPIPPLIDGILSPGEYGNASRLVFDGYGGDIEVFINQTGSDLVIAFNSSDQTPYPYNSGGGTGPAFQVFLDTLNDRASLPQADDYRLTLSKGNTIIEATGNSSSWSTIPPTLWQAVSRVVPWGWQGEFAINFAKLGLVSPSPQVIGFSMAEVWTPSWPSDWYWPSGAFYAKPSTWGWLGSSSDWSSFYWKPGPWTDYAPSGMPDFDQRQATWWVPGISGPIWTHSGPVAAANSLWWFDSKFESLLIPPPAPADSYRLVKPFLAGFDDHFIENVIPFVDDLALNYFNTNNGIVGTDIIQMAAGMDSYLRKRGLWDDYSVTLVEKPSFEWVADEVMRSEDVILLLGIWEYTELETWQRVGGHYVTVAGVDLNQRRIAFSDPYQDASEIGFPGRVAHGMLIPHVPIPGHPPFVHNDAGNVSQDIYQVIQTNSPGGTWGPVDYPFDELFLLAGANPHPEFKTFPWSGGKIQLEVEYALAVSPFRWKSSGQWDMADEIWVPWMDYAPSGMPDFDQRQDNWMDPTGLSWSFCAPAAAANSLWWFDSKLEPTPLMPPGFNDNYSLVSSFASMLPAWDDHDPLNVDSPASLWPPGGELVEVLAQYFGTNLLSSGSNIQDVYQGISNYINDRHLLHEYTVSLNQTPDFWWIADHIRRSSDTLLLLGFYELMPGGEFQRLGGHYVSASGVDLQGGYIAFSDPWFNRIETSWPLAGPLPSSGWPWYTGRMSTGFIFPHTHPGVPPEISHNDAGNISHDIYRVMPSPVTGGAWLIDQYATSWSQVENFWGQNGGGAPYLGGPIFTEVEWAVVVSNVKTWGIYLPILLRP